VHIGGPKAGSLPAPADAPSFIWKGLIMKRSTKILCSTTGFLAAAAFSGMICGTNRTAAAATTAGVRANAAKISLDAKAGIKANMLDDSAGKHDCKGKNDCKGKGGCKTDSNSCKGQNDCKGKGGCKVDAPTSSPSTKPSI
jgi:hypothetical protein